MADAYKPEDILVYYLQKCKNYDFTAEPVKLHSAFYDLYLKNKDKMSDFEFIVRINPFSPTLEILIEYFQLCGIVSRKNPLFVHYTIDRDKLNKLSSGNQGNLELDEPESMQKIFA